MENKLLYKAWAPIEGETWTRFAKPALFANIHKIGGWNVPDADIPHDIRSLTDGKTAIIVDMPGAKGVEIGLGLARIGFRPVPLYNGIHETSNGVLPNIVDNIPIIDALAASVATLRFINANIHPKAPPAFLLDSSRYPQLPSTMGMYDNRWNVELDDMPSFTYMKEQGINRLVIWTEDKIQDDLIPIANSYRAAGIIVASTNSKTRYDINAFSDIVKATPEASTPEIVPEIKEAVRIFENARFGLLLAILFAGLNLFGMFFVNEKPILWTTPSIMWLTYLWVSEIVGDIIAIALSVFYLAIYILSYKRPDLIVVALAVFGFDVLVYFIYVYNYGIAAFTGYSLFYGIIVFVPPIISIILLIRGVAVYQKISELSEADYLLCLNHIDDLLSDRLDDLSPSRRIFRPYRTANYRGYSGYGGTGRGGYGGYGGGGYGG